MSEPTCPISIIVRYDIGLLSPNKRLHPAVRRQRQRESALAALAAYREAGSPSVDVPVSVDLIVRRGRGLDRTNLIAAQKQIEDAIFNRDRNGEGVTPNDSPRWVESGSVTQECDRRWIGREELEFRIYPQFWCMARKEA